MDWNMRYQKQDTPWCKGREHPMLGRLLDQVLPEDFNGRIIAPGCGRGWDLAAIAKHRPAAEVVGIDVSSTAIHEATRRLTHFPNVRLLHGDFLDSGWIAQQVGEVELVWEHTCFCAIDPTHRPDYRNSAATILKPGGHLAGLFFLHLDDQGSGPPWNCPEHEFRQCFESAFVVESSEIATDTFEGRDGEEFAVVLRRQG